MKNQSLSIRNPLIIRTFGFLKIGFGSEADKKKFFRSYFPYFSTVFVYQKITLQS